MERHRQIQTNLDILCERSPLEPLVKGVLCLLSSRVTGELGGGGSIAAHRTIRLERRKDSWTGRYYDQAVLLLLVQLIFYVAGKCGNNARYREDEPGSISCLPSPLELVRKGIMFGIPGTWVVWQTKGKLGEGWGSAALVRVQSFSWVGKDEDLL